MYVMNYMLIYIIDCMSETNSLSELVSLNDKMDKVFINIIMLKEKGILTHLINMRYL